MLSGIWQQPAVDSVLFLLYRIRNTLFTIIRAYIQFIIIIEIYAYTLSKMTLHITAGVTKVHYRITLRVFATHSRINEKTRGTTESHQFSLY